MKLTGYLLGLGIYILALTSGEDVYAQGRSPLARQDEVAVTFDDLPFVGAQRESASRLRPWMQQLVDVLTTNQVPATGFVNEIMLYQDNKLDDDKLALLKLWLDAGFDLGNHTFSHVSLNDSSIEDFESDILRGEALSRKLMEDKGKQLRYFRHPFLAVGTTLQTRARVEKFLADHAYKVAPVTVNNGEWIFHAAYSTAMADNDAVTMHRIGEAYLDHIEQCFDYAEDISHELFGYNIKHVIVLHANKLNADYFDELAKRLQRRGYRFVSLDEALTDKAYGSLNTYAGEINASWIVQWARSVGIRPEKAPQPPLFVQQLAGYSLYSNYR